MSVMAWPSAPAASPLLRQCGAALGDRVLRLQDEPLAILKGLYRLGSLVVTTFSSGSKVSQSMRYPTLNDGEWSLESVGERCRLRQNLLVTQWHSVLAVLEPTGSLPARSLLFLDRHGQPLQQMAVAPDSGGLAFEELVCAMLHPDQQALDLPRPCGVSLRGVGHSLNEMERVWSGSRDDDDFASLLAGYPGTRSSLYASVRDSFACQVRPETLPVVLAESACQDAATTLCVGNQGVRLCMTAPWSSPRWQNSHCHLAHNGALVSLDMSKMHSLWRLRKPGDGQVVTALEALDENGDWLWTLSAGEDEQHWRDLLKGAVIR
ncbi:MAG: hypothetical protein VX258_04300 [Pseudomonadota bacterium]|jgi:putative hemin transport protein|nr:hypothetical protein [Pseudomonadota bacterium]